MNKKVVLSVLSTAVVASMATAAFAKPSTGLYIGGSVDKYYSITQFLNNEDQVIEEINNTGFGDVLYVDDQGKAATIGEVVSADDLDDVLETATLEDFKGNTYAKADGTTYDPSTDSDLTGAPAGDLKVESVSAINAKELVIEFNQAVKASSVVAPTGVAGPEVAGTLVNGVVNIDSAPADTLNASLSKDGKKLTIVAAGAGTWQGAHSVEFVADKVETADGKAKLASFVKAFSFSDDVRASITGVDYVSKFVYTVNFSEPVTSTGAVSAKLADGTAVVLNTAATGYGLSADGKSFKVVFDNATPVNKEITVNFAALTDGAGNVSIPLDAKVTINGTDTTKPAVTSAVATSQTTVKVKFTEAITVADATKVKFNGTAAPAVVNADDNTVLDITVPTTTTSGALSIEAGAIEDLNGNANAAFSQAVNFASDTVAPTVSSTEVFKDAGLNKLRVTFSEDVTKVGTTGLTLKYTDEYGVAKTIAIPDGKIAVDGTDKKVVVIDLHDGTNPVKENVTYTVDITAGYFVDTFTNQSVLKTVTFVNSANAATTKLALISTNPIVTTDTVPGGTATRTNSGAFVDVQFADTVDASSATNKANYAVEGADVEKAELVYNNPTTPNANGAKAVVRVFIKDNTVEQNGNYNVTVSGVKGYNANVAEMNSATKNVQIVENTRPTVTAATFSAFDATAPSTTVTLTFSEAIATDASPDGDFDLYVGGTKVSTVTLTNGALGSAIDVTIDKDLSADVAAGKQVKLVAKSGLDLADASGNKASVTEVVVR
ncbi:hypothetical protein [Brevibacillus nitrificans]|uniref:hypothetical protein n=1 Tax=Brevibacillus nitrificans TaxID=651560 RepID=UPI0028597284|nr:hypothetical protein [Brevibacillus nitrificans]MDR7315327.1 hypothetical protein [Brevibacillus nitrificans]